MNIYAIGDIHGCSKQLISLQEKILNHSSFKKDSDLLVYLGDYIDRGSHSKEVINQVIKLKKENIKSIFLMGNHEQMMIDFLFNEINNLRYWLNLGADQTFRSYDIEVAEFIKDGFGSEKIRNLRIELYKKIPLTHKNFLKNLKLSYTVGNYLFVHAGINPKKSLSEQNQIDFLWSRSDQFFHKNFQYEKIVIHGHTPEKKVINFSYRINIDTGCFFSKKLSSVCVNSENEKREFIYS
jgi:serine/threonine protein phosphatase 1